MQDKTKDFSIEILDLNLKLVGEVKQIEIECGLSPWTEDDYRNEILREDSIALAAKHTDILVGFLVARLITPQEESLQNGQKYDSNYRPLRESGIYNIAVREEFQNRGVGQTLLSNFLNRAREASISKIWLEVRESNHSAIGFYRKNGFIEIYKRKNFYRDPLENGIVMSLELSFEK